MIFYDFLLYFLPSLVLVSYFTRRRIHRDSNSLSAGSTELSVSSWRDIPVPSASQVSSKSRLNTDSSSSSSLSSSATSTSFKVADIFGGVAPPSGIKDPHQLPPLLARKFSNQAPLNSSSSSSSVVYARSTLPSDVQSSVPTNADTETISTRKTSGGIRSNNVASAFAPDMIVRRKIYFSTFFFPFKSFFCHVLCFHFLCLFPCL